MLKGWAARGKEVGGIHLIPWNTISSVLRKHFLSNMFAYKNFISFFCVFSYCSCKLGNKRAVLGQQFRQKERDFSVQLTEMTRPVKEDHLQSGSRIFQTKPKESVPFDVPTKISGILDWMEKALPFQYSGISK